MKIACSSASFERALAEGRWTQLEWLDACANELEVDGVVFDAAHFPRDDADYLAQLKKLAADLGLTVAALAADGAASAACERYLHMATALGAPLVVARAPKAGDDASAWSDFSAGVHLAARAAKRTNVTLAVQNHRGTLCEDGSDLRRLAKDVDSAWLRYALDTTSLHATDDVTALLPRCVIATHTIAGLETFAAPADGEAAHLVDSLARFRGFVLLEAAGHTAYAYHDAIARFARYRARSLATIH